MIWCNKTHFEYMYSFFLIKFRLCPQMKLSRQRLTFYALPRLWLTWTVAKATRVTHVNTRWSPKMVNDHTSQIRLFFCGSTNELPSMKWRRKNFTSEIERQRRKALGQLMSLRSFIHSFIYSYIHSFIHSSIYSWLIRKSVLKLVSAFIAFSTQFI